jgi:small-conductance mechanosensitive channel
MEILETLLLGDIWNTVFFGNTVGEIAIAVGIFFGVLLCIWVFKTVILKRLDTLVAKTETDVDDQLVHMLENISTFFFWFLSLYITIRMLKTNVQFQAVLDGIFLALVVYEAIKIAQSLINYAFIKSGRKDETILNGVRLIAKIVLWSIGILLILSNLGFDISTLAASLGIGGIAIALAAQNILGDLFASFTIYFDKTFKIGDYVVIGSMAEGENKGIVQHIGLKSTRIKTLQGEELIVSNKLLTESRIQNFKKMKRRRVDIEFGIEYGTPTAKMKKIPEIMQKIVDKEKMAEYGRTHFFEFGAFSLNYKLMFYMTTGEFSDYLDTRQNISLEMKETFEKEGISMAFPTQTVIVKKD